jgi:hypothetical protein
VGRSSEVWSLYQDTTSGEIGVTNIYPSNPKPGGENSTETLSNFKLWETPKDGIIGNREADIEVSKGGQ